MSTESNAPPPYEGGCACGAVRYSFSAEAIGARICHCRACQRAMGAPFLAQASFPRAALTLTGATSRFRSSERLWRHFCKICGTQLFVEPVDAPDRLGIPIATLDNPAAISPEMHIWVSMKLPWIELADDLPKYPEASPTSYREG
jgi:hypothetical protein